ncbi:ATP-grasp domain-containing protein [bacterium]|nr:ATP-grasp domain-containing protein [bacterium]
MSFQVLIVSNENLIGLARLPKVLSEANCTVSLIAPTENFVSQTSFVTNFFPVSKDLNSQIAFLKNHLTQKNYDFTIIGSEVILEALKPFANEKWCQTILPVTSFEELETITSKTKFLRKARENGIPTPFSVECSNLDEVRKQSKKFVFPLVLKEEKSSCGLGVHIVSNQNELESVFQKIQVEITLQEFVDGKIGTTEVLFSKGKPVCWFSSFSLVCLPKRTGMSCVREICEQKEVEQILLQVGKMTNFTGFGGIDWILETKTNKVKLLEFNARTTPAYHLGKLADVNFSLAFQKMLEGKEFVQKPTLPKKELRTVYLFPQDIQRILTDFDLKLLKRWLPFLQTSQDLPFDDKKLLLTHLKSQAKFFLTKLKKKVVKNV